MSRSSNPTFEALHEYHVDVSRRRVFLTSAMHDSGLQAADGELKGNTDYVARNLVWLDSHGEGNVELWINSPGGDPVEMWAIYDIVRTMKCRVDTVVYGQACSSACLILAAGTGTRTAMPNAWFMWHGGTAATGGLGPGELDDRAAWAREETQRWLEAMGRHTTPPLNLKRRPTVKQRAAYWKRWIHDRERWLDAEGMLGHGIIDQVWTEGDD